MDKREYLRSLGFVVGERGRFSAEMKAALEGKTFDEAPKPDAPVQVEDEPIPPITPYKERTDGVRTMYVTLTNGTNIRFDTCGKCRNYIKYCTHQTPVLPDWVAKEVDTMVLERVG